MRARARACAWRLERRADLPSQPRHFGHVPHPASATTGKPAAAALQPAGLLRAGPLPDFPPQRPQPREQPARQNTATNYYHSNSFARNKERKGGSACISAISGCKSSLGWGRESGCVLRRHRGEYGNSTLPLALGARGTGVAFFCVFFCFVSFQIRTIEARRLQRIERIAEKVRKVRATRRFKRLVIIPALAAKNKDEPCSSHGAGRDESSPRRGCASRTQM